MSHEPFVIINGDSAQVAIRNRINAIDRIKHLSGIDIRYKSKEYMLGLDLKMWEKWYKDLPMNTIIDEEYCQRASEVLKEMEKYPDRVIKESAKKIEKILREESEKKPGILKKIWRKFHAK